MSFLTVEDPFILSHTPQARFTYICQDLDGLLLDPRGIRALDFDCTVFEMYLCRECLAYMHRSIMPRLALKNHLYRGELPEDLQNVTWVEEMACSIYRTSAHVTRIFGSSSECDPFQLHGNTCAHPLNICYTAKRLPWSPADLNDLISIIFVGPKKLAKEDLQKLTPFFVRRSVIRMLLLYLQKHNRLYIELPPIDEQVLAMYPDNNLLPGLQDRFIY
ncbi:hypothetical protein F5877DRAFT_36794, partial [Lentinula edodes]